MKKIILAVAIAGLAISCQKIQAGGNKGALKMQDGVERYTDDMMSDEATAAFNAADAAKTGAMIAADSTKVVAHPAVVVKADSTLEVKTAEMPSSTETK